MVWSMGKPNQDLAAPLGNGGNSRWVERSHCTGMRLTKPGNPQIRMGRFQFGDLAADLKFEGPVLIREIPARSVPNEGCASDQSVRLDIILTLIVAESWELGLV